MHQIWHLREKKNQSFISPPYTYLMIWYIFIFNYIVRGEGEISNKLFGVQGLPGFNGALAVHDPLSPPSIPPCWPQLRFTPA